MAFIAGSDGNDNLAGTGENDTFLGAGGSDVISGGGGFDIVVYWSSPFAVGIRLFANVTDNDGFGGTDQLFGISGAAGSGWNDVIFGNDFGNLLLGLTGDDSIFGLGGDDLIRGAEGNDSLDGGDGTDRLFLFGNRADYTITASGSGFVIQDNFPAGREQNDGRDTVTSFEEFQFADRRIAVANILDPNAPGIVDPAADGVIRGGGGRDVLQGTGANDTIDGGADVDTLASTALRREVSLTGNPSASATMSGPEGVDSLLSIESVRFADGWLSFDPLTTSGSVLRLYQATLGRAPDPIGFGFWVSSLETGAFSLSQAAQGFVGSAEFQQRYGALDNSSFVTLLYNNVLGRAPDAGGLQFWTGQLDSNAMSRTDVVLGFSESAEFTNLTGARFQSGVWAPDPVAVDIMRYYETVLDRLPDAGGLSFWISARNNGLSLPQMADAFVGSSEFQTRYGALTNQAFVEQLYLNSLDRPGDAGGLQYWTNALNTGAFTRADVVAGFAFSDEMTAKLTPAAADGILFV